MSRWHQLVTARAAFVGTLLAPAAPADTYAKDTGIDALNDAFT